jgi:hypothetical protein
MTRAFGSRALLLAALAVVATGVVASASGPIGIYGIVQRVVFEPNERTPERIQIWGAFAYAEGGPQGGGQFSIARKGYLYFSMPAGDAKLGETVRKEWMDLKAIAGTGQAVGFGMWAYIGGFGTLDPSVKSAQTDLRVRPAAEKPGAPAVYQTNVGLVKIPAAGSRADLVKRLQQALDAQ